MTNKSAELSILTLSSNLVQVSLQIDTLPSPINLGTSDKNQLNQKLKTYSQIAPTTLASILCSGVGYVYKNNPFLSKLIDLNSKTNIRLDRNINSSDAVVSVTFKGQTYVEHSQNTASALDVVLMKVFAPTAPLSAEYMAPYPLIEKQVTREFIQQIEQNELSKDEIVEHLKSLIQ